MLALFDAVGRQTGPAAEVEATHQNAGGAERAPKEVHHLFDSAGQPITLEAYRCEAAGCGELFQYRWALLAHQNCHKVKLTGLTQNLQVDPAVLIEKSL